MRHCVECGEPVGDGWKHCAACGAQLPIGEAHASPAATSPQADSGDTEARGWFHRHRKALAIAGIVVLGLGVLGTVDWFARNNELSALTSADNRSDNALINFDDAMDECASRNDADTAFGQNQTRECFQEEAAKALPRILAGEERIHDVRVLPWHGDIRKAKDRTAEYYESYEQLMRDIASARYKGITVRYSERSAAYRSARRAYRGAIPMFPLFHLQSRVDDLYPE